MKDILMLAGRKPYPLDDGWKIRTFFLLKALSKLGGAVDLLVFDETGGREDCSELEKLCRQVVTVPREKAYGSLDLLRGLLFATPFSVLNYEDKRFARAVEELVTRNDYGYIQVEDIVMAQYAWKEADIRKVLDMHNIESELLLRYAINTDNPLQSMYARLTAEKLERYEMRMAERFDAVLVCSPEEQTALRHKGLKTSVDVIPNGVDCAFYGNQSGRSKEDALVFVGSMDYHANISGILHFADRVLPLLKSVRSDLKIYVVGKNPPPDIVALSDENLIITGAVDDVRPYLERGLISIVPLQVGGGTRLKILEAMASGLPVVSTPLGAEGIDVTHGENIMLAGTAKEFADHVLRLLDHPDQRRELADNGRKFVLENYDWSVVTAGLKDRVAILSGGYV